MSKLEQFIHIKSAKFPILPGEKEEVVNDGMYGKALSLYLQEQLPKRGYEVPFTCAEDWGWWVEFRGDSLKGGICIYCGPGEDRKLEYACLIGLKSNISWSWKKLKTIDHTDLINKLFDDLVDIFEQDPEVTLIGITEDCPVEQEESVLAK